MKSLMKRFVALLMIWALQASMMTPAHADFLDDFFTEAGSQVNVTPAGAYQSAAGTIVTGGNVVLRTQRKDFRPFYITPPSLRMGCGGIDLFLGAFGVASKAEFIAFLRNLGQNATVLAFKLALQAISPELESQIKEMADELNKLNQFNMNSCQMADSLTKGPAGQAMKSTIQGAKGYLRDLMSVKDEQEAKEATELNAAHSVANAPPEQGTTVDAAGNQIPSPPVRAEANLTWRYLRSSGSDLPREDLELMMSMVGTIILRRDPAAADDGPLQVETRAPSVKMLEVLGQPNVASTDVRVWTCPDEDCLTPVLAPRTIVSFAARMQAASHNLVNAIRMRDRTAILPSELMLLQSTSIPLINLISASTYSNFVTVGLAEVDKWADAAALELVTIAMDNTLDSVQRAALNFKSATDKSNYEKETREFLERVRANRAELENVRSHLVSTTARMGSYVQVLDHFERSMKSGVSRQLQDNLAFARR